MKRFPLSLYVAGVLIVLAIINGVVWSVHGGMHATNLSIFSGGFLTGMLAMYVAVHVYRYE